MYCYRFVFVLSLINSFAITNTDAVRKYTRQDLLKLREEVRDMFNHAYSGYLKYAFPYDELRPLTCDGVDTWGSYSLTLIDALDTLVVMGNYSEFRRVVDIVISKANFDANINVSVFETNIRIVGGLLSAHLFSQRAGVKVEPGWPCNGPLLRLAEDVARRLLPAFNTKTGMPYGTVNLRHGVPTGETSVTCTAGVGTFIVEFGTISRLTGDPVYEEVALNALKVLYEHRSSIGLYGNHIDVNSGKWIARDSGIGAGVDSYFEYLVKGSILLQRPELMAMFNEARKPIDKYLKKNNWYVWASMSKGQVTLPVFQSLEAYWPGVLTLIGDVESALRSMHNYNSVWKQYGFTPEFYNIAQGQAGTNRESYPLRPELAESAMYLYRATGDPFMLDIGLNILRSIQHSAKTECGYATIKDTRDHTQENRMESFFLAETTKYLYLLFDPDNFIHNKGQHGIVHVLPSGKQCVLDSGGYIFNTEAHPVDPGALSCCYDWNQISISNDRFTFKGERLKNKQKDKKSKEKVAEKPIESNIIQGTAEVWPIEDLSLEETPNVLNQPQKLDKPEQGDLNGKQTEGSLETKDNLNKLLSMIKTNHDKILAALQKLSTSKEENKDFEDVFDRDEKNVGNIKDAILNKEHQPEFHQDSDGMTTENTSQNPLVAPEWANGNLSEARESGEQEHVDKKSGLMTLPEYVKQLVGSPSHKPKFDPQQLIEIIRANKRKMDSWETQYDLLSCKAQPFLIRLMIAGEFLDEK